MIIKQTRFSVNHSKMLDDLNYVLANHASWPEYDPQNPRKTINQISLRHRQNATGDLWADGNGSLINRETGSILAVESDFSQWNAKLPEYTKQVLEQLMSTEKVNFGRVRYMRLMPKTGLTVHTDTEQRYHLVLTTHRFAMFGHVYEGGEELGKVYHMPADGHFYKVDTTLGHFVYNGSMQERIHLVCSIAN
jgi:hypothetical protein